MKKLHLTLTTLLIVFCTSAQNLKPIAQKINNKKAEQAVFTDVHLFDVTVSSLQKATELTSVVSNSTVMEFRQSSAANIVNSPPENIHFSIPTSSGVSIELELYRSSIFTPDFSVVTSSSDGREVPYRGGVHYWGIINGDNNSIAAISIYNDKVMGLISSSAGNVVLGQLENDATGRHILYNDRDLKTTPPIECATTTDNTGYRSEELQNPNRVLTNCIRLFWEVNYDIYQGQGSVTNAANYVTGLFNQSAIIYANDGIPVELSEVYVWNTTSPYTNSSTSGQLGLFQSTRNSINGDLGHLLGYTGGGGVAAGFSGICASNLDASQCYSMIYSTYSNVPTYSWSVMVVTHEQGHLMGSRHTHACVWNGNNTAIDGCGPAAGYGYEGSCSGAPIPSTGGTIMSYCHLNAVGINFNNGFGTQPKNVILNNFNNGACLTSCIGNSCMPSANMSTSSVASTTALFNWNAVANATGYNIRYRVVGNSTWTTVNSVTSPYSASGLTAGANYEWQVQTVCSGGNSIFTISTNFTTTPVTCNTPTNLTTTNIAYSSATFNWSAASGVSSYAIRYRIVGTSTWTATTATAAAVSYNAFSLSASSNYEWQIQTLCSGGGTSAYSSSILFTTPAQPCNVPQNLYTTAITSTSATFNFPGTIGGGTFNVRYRVVGNSTWTTITNAVSPYIVNGLTPSSNYEWQVQQICAGGQSAYSTSVLFTTTCAQPGATVSAGGPTIFCAGGIVLLTANGGTGFTYQWQLNGSNLAGMVSMNLPVTASGLYRVIVYSGACSDTSLATTVTVNPLPTVTAANVGGCAGTSIALSGTPAGGAWSVTNPYTGTSSTTYTHTYTDANGCTNTSASATITINPLPTILIGGNTSVCNGSNTTLTASGALTYQWTNGPATVGYQFTPISTSTYTVTGTDANGCVNTASQLVTVNPLPTVSFSGLVSNYLVTAAAVTLTGSPSGGTFSGPGISGNLFSPANAGAGGPYTITYSYTGGNGCSNSSSQQTSVTNCAVPAQPGTISVTGGAKVCPGDTRTYKVTKVTGLTYNWTPVAGGTIQSGQGTNQVVVNYTANFIANGTISVTANNGCGASMPRTLAVIRNVPATPGTISGLLNGVCNLSNQSYSVTTVANVTYNWSFTVATAVVATGQGTSAITANYNTGFVSATLKVTANNACGASAVRSATIKAAPAVPTAITGTTTPCANQSGVSYSVAPVAFATKYTWTAPTGSHINDGTTTSSGASLTTTSNSVTVNFGSTSGNITCKAGNTCGFSSTKNLAITFACRQANPLEENNMETIQLFPNPFSQSTKLVIPNSIDLKNVNVLIYNILGKEVKRISNLTDHSITINRDQLSAGLYMLTLNVKGNKTQMQKFCIQ